MLTIFGFIILSSILLSLGWFFSKKEVNASDIIGKYKIDKSQFSGKNADWQYEHFKFEITEQDSFILYIINDNKKIVNTFRYAIKNNDRGRFYIQKPTTYYNYHVLKEQPTLYRKRFSFYYVFQSSLYGNMFFTKKKWYERF